MGSSRAVALPKATQSLTLIATLLLAATAHADPKACITAHATGQREAKAGHLRLATQLFTSCGSDESCPAQLRQECAEFLKSVEQSVPTVIFSVVDENNQDVNGVKVFSSDELLIDGLTGRAIHVDPGKHHLRFLLPSGEILNSDVLIREGEKSRLIEVKTKDDTQPEATPTPPPAPPPQAEVPIFTEAPLPPPPERRTLPIAFWIASGTALAGAGVGITYAVIGKSEKNDLSECAPHCTEIMRSTYDHLKRDYLIADIGFGVSIVSAGIATYFLVSTYSGSQERRSSSVAPKTALSNVVPTCSVTRDTTWLSWAGRF